MSQPRTARQSLEQALEEYGVQNEGPTSGLGLQQLARSSVKDEVGQYSPTHAVADLLLSNKSHLHARHG